MVFLPGSRDTGDQNQNFSVSLCLCGDGFQEWLALIECGRYRMLYSWYFGSPSSLCFCKKAHASLLIEDERL